MSARANPAKFLQTLRAISPTPKLSPKNLSKFFLTIFAIFAAISLAPTTQATTDLGALLRALDSDPTLRAELPRDFDAQDFSSSKKIQKTNFKKSPTLAEILRQKSAAPRRDSSQNFPENSDQNSENFSEKNPKTSPTNFWNSRTDADFSDDFPRPDSSELSPKLSENSSQKISEKIRLSPAAEISSKFDPAEIRELTTQTVHALDAALTIPGLLDALEQISIIAEPNGKRGSASRSRITINLHEIDSLPEFQQVLIHELGHIVDLGLLQGRAPRLDHDFTEFSLPKFARDDPSIPFYSLSRSTETDKKSLDSTTEFCSIYGRTNPFEDFAECFNLFLSHPETFARRARVDTTLSQKFKFLQKILDPEIFTTHSEFAPSPTTRARTQNLTRRPRDATRLD